MTDPAFQLGQGVKGEGRKRLQLGLLGSEGFRDNPLGGAMQPNIGDGSELCRNLGDAVDQTAWLAGIAMTSTPFWNLTPWTTLGN